MESRSEDSSRLILVAMTSRRPFNPLQEESSQRGRGESQMCYHLCSFTEKISAIASELILPKGLAARSILSAPLVYSVIPHVQARYLPASHSVFKVLSVPCCSNARFVVVTLCYPGNTKTVQTKSSEVRTQVGDIRNTGRLNNIRIKESMQGASGSKPGN